MSDEFSCSLTLITYNSKLKKMDRLEINQKREGDELTAPEWNSNVDKINEIVDALNGSSTVQRKIFVQNNLGSKNLAAQTGRPCILDFTFISQERYSYNDPYENTGERGLCTVSVKNSQYKEFTKVLEYNTPASVPQKLDVTEYLTSGVNQIMINVKGEITQESTPAYVYNIQLTSLGIEASNFRWWQAYVGNIVLPLLISGNISKKLHVSVQGKTNDYQAQYSANIGTATYVETAYNYSILHPQREGVYIVSAWLSNADDSLRTKAVSFEIMCSVPDNLRKLVAINNKSERLINWSENTAFDYAIYHGMATSASATFTVKKGNEVVYSSVENAIPTGTKLTFSFPMDIETDDDADFQVDIDILDENDDKLTEPIYFEVGNSAGYSATSGAVFYMNPRTRSNNQTNREDIINETNKESVTANWLNMNWGNDGWKSDEDGNRLLRILSGSRCEIDYKPFIRESARTGKTIELDLKAYNVVDGSVPVIDISTPQGDSFIGLKVTPEEILMFSQSEKDKTTQNLPMDSEIRMRLAITIMPEAYGNSGFNIACVYINSVKNRVFNYQINDYFQHPANITIGSDMADVDVYGIRIYDAALTSEGIQKNYISWLASNTDKAEEVETNNVLDSAGKEVDFLNTVDQYNCFVFDKSFPKLSNPSEQEGTLEVYYAGNTQPYCTVSNVKCDGQGTSSKKYYEWNMRFRVDKAPESVTTYADGRTEKQLIDLFPGVTPKMNRITAKKNWASSMQDHKAGSVNAFDSLAKKLGHTNPAIDTDGKVRVAVYQEPFVGFSKQLNEDGEWVYTCMGLFTMGPDKGDKNCFGYDTKKFPGLIAIEGADNSPLLTLFRVPWRTPYVAYNEEEEAFQYNGANAWDFNGGKESNIDSWIPAYNLVYTCSPRIRPYKGTLVQLNADVINYRSTGYEYWIAKTGDPDLYNLYYYEASKGIFVGSSTENEGNTPINLRNQLVGKGYGLVETDLQGKTEEEINKIFINARTEKFKQEAGQYFDIDDAVFHSNFIEFIAGTDNRAKNTYAYNFGTGKWKWRQDDLDTIFPIDNQGQDKKPYWVEVHDQYDNGANVWNGETSNFWNLLELAFPDKLVTGMRSMLKAMEELGGGTGSTYDRIYAFYEKYYLGVKKYFPPTLFNADAKRYEDAKVAYLRGDYSNDTDPITQSHGDFYSAETAWVKKRILYMMSKYSYGMFSADGTDIITVRAAGDEIIYNLIPAISMYPAIASGTSIIRGERTMAGDPCRMVIDLGGAGDQQNNIQGASWLKSIGQWHDKNVSGTMVIQGRRLQEITLGHPSEPITISITGLTVSNCPSVRLVDLRRIKTLSGSIDLSSCIHLEDVYVGGTSLSQIRLPEGGGLRSVGFSAHNSYLMLRNFPVLERSGVDVSLCADTITDFYVQDCPRLNPIDMLLEVMEAQDGKENRPLKRVRAVGFNATYTDNGSYVLDRLAQLADGSYVGLDTGGLAGDEPYPVLDGELTIHSTVYQDSIDILQERFPKLTLNIVGERYVRFKDPEIHRIVVNKWGNGIGVTQAQLDTVTKIDDTSLFAGNMLIKDFSDFGSTFRNVNCIRYGVFKDCVNLRKFGMVTPVLFSTNNIGAFHNTGLDEHGIDLNKVRPDESSKYGTLFTQCKFINIFIPVTCSCNISDGVPSFADNELLRSVVLEEGITYAGNFLQGNSALTKVDFPSTISTIGNDGSGMFGNTRMSDLKQYIVRAVIPPIFKIAINGYDFSSDFRIYVPDGSITAYKVAPGWEKYVDRIVGLSTL